MDSKLMTEKEIIDYIDKNLAYFSDKTRLTCKEIGDGNINYVFRIEDKKDNKSLIVKQADILLRSSKRALDIKRNKLEAKMLENQYKLFPSSVPKVYLYDKEKSLIVMEDISSYKNLRKELIAGKIYGHLPNSLSDFLAKTLIPTTDLVMDRKEKKLLQKEFINPDMSDISEDLVFTEPYYNYKNRNVISGGLEDFVLEKLYKNQKLQFEILKLKDKFQTSGQALIHGDLHLGSIFVNEEKIKVIDPEFAFYGPIGYDIGNVWGNLFFPLTNAIIRKRDKKTIEKLEKLIIDTIDLTGKKLYRTYDKLVTNEFYKNDYYKNYYIENIISDSFAYAGTEIIRRDVGDSKVLEIESIEDRNLRIKLDKILIELGIYLILNRRQIKDANYLLYHYKKILEKYIW